MLNDDDDDDDAAVAAAAAAESDTPALLLLLLLINVPSDISDACGVAGVRETDGVVGGANVRADAVLEVEDADKSLVGVRALIHRQGAR